MCIGCFFGGIVNFLIGIVIIIVKLILLIFIVFIGFTGGVIIATSFLSRPDSDSGSSSEEPLNKEMMFNELDSSDKESAQKINDEIANASTSVLA
jgi:hypothetical protein